MTIQFYLATPSETIEILTATGADRGSFSDDCDLGVCTSRLCPSVPHSRVEIDSCLCVSNRTRAIDACSCYVWRGVVGQPAAILASETHSIYEYGLCMHAVRFSSVCGVHRTSCFPWSLSGMRMALQVRMTQLTHADQCTAR